jgi:hypothetical protein
MDNNVYMGLAVMGSQKNHLQEEKNKLEDQIANIEEQKNAQISKIQLEVDDLDKQMLELDKKMNKAKLIAQKQDEKTAKEKEVAQAQKQDTGEVKANPTKLTLPVEEDGAVGAVGGGDGAINTGSLDASSQATGGGSAKPGWKFYNKIGADKKRELPKKKINEFMDHVWDSYIE